MKYTEKMAMPAEVKMVDDLFGISKEQSDVLITLGLLPAEERQHKTAEYLVELIIAAINKKHNGGKKYVPNWADGSRKWQIVWLWFRPAKADDKPEDVVTNRDGVGFVVHDSGCDFTRAATYCGSRHSFCTEDALIEFRDNKKFLNLYAQIKV